jgi:hypothetical protein
LQMGRVGASPPGAASARLQLSQAGTAWMPASAGMTES